jgi:dipeptidyl aminopeptidase/acylaminoacyl peptidase
MLNARRTLALFLPLLLLAPHRAAAQQPPGTDIYLVDLVVRDGSLQVGNAVNITDRAGYDNQPAFTADGRSLLYTSIREDGQADIYRYEIVSREMVRVTRTAESEYSPTLTPDLRGISVVRVEPDSTQRLWRFDLEGGEAELLLPELRPVGYHAWADEQTVALFVLGSPATLQLADLRTGRGEVIAENIGRSLHRVPGRSAISFLRRTPEGERWIEELDIASRTVRPLVRPLEPGEDYSWTPDGKLLMGRGAKLFAWDPALGEEWLEVADLSAAGIGEITRLAVSPQGDRIALVAERGR